MAGDSSRHHDKIEKLRLLKSSKQYQLTLAQLFWSQQHYIALEYAVLPSPCWTTAGSGWRANPGEGRGRRAIRTSKKLDKTLLCWNNILVQLWGGLTWMLLAVNVLWIDSLENWHQESSSRHSLQPLSNQLKKKKKGFLWQTRIKAVFFRFLHCAQVIQPLRQWQILASYSWRPHWVSEHSEVGKYLQMYVS